ncbi:MULTISPECIES: GNAT family N-acetyltransferase [unclassified Enterococcus]|jgi:riboflavin biosynthesis RibT protein|uniref:GNAT family N-acetyltransferase n=1 Tax=unclassified Enterococcus TaxID=2608891 RepID=UPI003D268588
MLTYYRKENRKIAMGLLSFHKKMSEQFSLLKEIDTYETDPAFELFFYTPEDSTNIQGVIGVEWLDKEHLIVHDISLNPSYRGEKIGYQMLDELQEKYPNVQFDHTEATKLFLTKWQTNKKE